MDESLSFSRLALLPGDYFYQTVVWPLSFPLSLFFLFILAKSSPAPAFAWVTPHDGIAPSREGYHRLEAVGCQLILVLYMCRGPLLNSADMTSCPTLQSRPTHRPTGMPQETCA